MLLIMLKFSSETSPSHHMSSKEVLSTDSARHLAPIESSLKRLRKSNLTHYMDPSERETLSILVTTRLLERVSNILRKENKTLLCTKRMSASQYGVTPSTPSLWLIQPFKTTSVM